MVPSPTEEPLPCHRISLGDDVETEIRGLDRDGTAELLARLSPGPVTYAELTSGLSVPQAQLLKRLLRAGMVTAAEQVGRAA